MQHDTFLKGEADKWFDRNKAHLKEYSGDYMLDYLKQQDLSGKKVLDVGCAHGERLEELRLLGAQCWGIEPSEAAIAAARTDFPKNTFTVGVSHELPYETGTFDIVTLAFVLHWVDRSKLLQTVSEIDRVLKDGGTLAIMDFYPIAPHRREYHHNLDLGVYTYKQAYADIFKATNLYTQVEVMKFRHPNGVDYDWHQRDDTLTGGDSDGILTIFNKDLKGNYPIKQI